MLQSRVMVIGVCCLRLHLPACGSLKTKRSLLKPLLARLHREFNVAAAETGLQDVWQSAEVAVVTVANNPARVQSQLETIVAWVEHNRPEVEVVDSQIELR
jgi:uncharacterized protein YlxP (DUF503 family)